MVYCSVKSGLKMRTDSSMLCFIPHCCLALLPLIKISNRFQALCMMIVDNIQHGLVPAGRTSRGSGDDMRMVFKRQHRIDW